MNKTSFIFIANTLIIIHTKFFTQYAGYTAVSLANHDASTRSLFIHPHTYTDAQVTLSLTLPISLNLLNLLNITGLLVIFSK